MTDLCPYFGVGPASKGAIASVPGSGIAEVDKAMGLPA